MDVETPAWSYWMLRGVAALAGLFLVRSGVHGLRGRPLGVADGTHLSTGGPWFARLWGAFTLVWAVVLFVFAAVGFTG
jgi:hypothetical protein